MIWYVFCLRRVPQLHLAESPPLPELQDRGPGLDVHFQATACVHIRLKIKNFIMKIVQNAAICPITVT